MISVETVPIIAPEIGAEDQTVRISCWLVEIGDYVNEGDRVIELVLNGITFDVSADVSGVLVEIESAENSVIQTGDCLGQIKLDMTESEGK